MPKPNHNFNKSKKTEIKSTHIHEEVYSKYQKDINKEYKRDFSIKVDREICNYDTQLGKAYQQADTDALVFFNCEDTQTTIVKNVSEKTRNKFYNDIYIEVVSVLKWNNTLKKYEFDSPGWGLKKEELSPDCLSMLFLDKQSYTNIFIENYKGLKEKLFNEELYKTLQSERFVLWLNNKIKEAQLQGKTSFQLGTEGQSKSNVSKVIFAKNNGYYTIGFTYKVDYIKSLVKVRQYKGQIVDQNALNM